MTTILTNKWKTCFFLIFPPKYKRCIQLLWTSSGNIWNWFCRAFFPDVNRPNISLCQKLLNLNKDGVICSEISHSEYNYNTIKTLGAEGGIITPSQRISPQPTIRAPSLTFTLLKSWSGSKYLSDTEIHDKTYQWQIFTNIYWRIQICWTGWSNLHHIHDPRPPFLDCYHQDQLDRRHLWQKFP